MSTVLLSTQRTKSYEKEKEYPSENKTTERIPFPENFNLSFVLEPKMKSKPLRRFPISYDFEKKIEKLRNIFFPPPEPPIVEKVPIVLPEQVELTLRKYSHKTVLKEGKMAEFGIALEKLATSDDPEENELAAHLWVDCALALDDAEISHSQLSQIGMDVFDELVNKNFEAALYILTYLVERRHVKLLEHISRFSVICTILEEKFPLINEDIHCQSLERLAFIAGKILMALPYCTKPRTELNQFAQDLIWLTNSLENYTKSSDYQKLRELARQKNLNFEKQAYPTKGEGDRETDEIKIPDTQWSTEIKQPRQKKKKGKARCGPAASTKSGPKKTSKKSKKKPMAASNVLFRAIDEGKKIEHFEALTWKSTLEKIKDSDNILLKVKILTSFLETFKESGFKGSPENQADLWLKALEFFAGHDKRQLWTLFQDEGNFQKIVDIIKQVKSEKKQVFLIHFFQHLIGHLEGSLDTTSDHYHVLFDKRVELHKLFNVKLTKEFFECVDLPLLRLCLPGTTEIEKVLSYWEIVKEAMANRVLSKCFSSREARCLFSAKDNLFAFLCANLNDAVFPKKEFKKILITLFTKPPEKMHTIEGLTELIALFRVLCDEELTAKQKLLSRSELESITTSLKRFGVGILRKHLTKKVPNPKNHHADLIRLIDLVRQVPAFTESKFFKLIFVDFLTHSSWPEFRHFFNTFQPKTLAHLEKEGRLIDILICAVRRLPSRNDLHQCIVQCFQEFTDNDRIPIKANKWLIRNCVRNIESDVKYQILEKIFSSVNKSSTHTYSFLTQLINLISNNEETDHLFYFTYNCLLVLLNLPITSGHTTRSLIESFTFCHPDLTSQIMAKMSAIQALGLKSGIYRSRIADYWKIQLFTKQYSKGQLAKFDVFLKADIGTGCIALVDEICERKDIQKTELVCRVLASVQEEIFEGRTKELLQCYKKLLNNVREINLLTQNVNLVAIAISTLRGAIQKLCESYKGAECGQLLNLCRILDSELKAKELIP